MINCTYESNGTNTFLVYKLSANEKIDTLSCGMISNNKISGVVPMLMTQINQDRYIKFNVSSKITLQQYFDGIVNKKQILKVFLSIVDAVLESEDYMLDSTYFYYDTQYIFVTLGTSEASIICVPTVPKKECCSLFDFLKSIMISTQFDSSEDTGYVAKIISFLNSSHNFSLLEFRKMINNLLSDNMVHNENNIKATTLENNQTEVTRSDSYEVNLQNKNCIPQNNFTPNASKNINMVQPPINKASQNMAEMPKQKKGLFGRGKKEKKIKQKNNSNQVLSPFDQQTPCYNGDQSVNNNPSVSVNNTIPTKNKMNSQNNSTANYIPAQQNQSIHNIQTQSANFGETTVLGTCNDGETSVLNTISNTQQNGQAGNSQAYLIRKKNNERIPINKACFKLGKEKSYVDYFIGDNSYISRGHANILTKNDQYYIVDNNSRNSTYINGRQLTGSVEEKIVSGDRISLANEDFEFIIN